VKLSIELHRSARSLIEQRLGLHFSETRHEDVERGILAGCRGAAIGAPEEYLAWLATLPDDSHEWRRLASRLTVGETYFFRDGACFEAIERVILPALIAARRAQGNLMLRLWSAACATGEEPYSLAIVLDRLLPDRSGWDVTILATDINHEALGTARQGVYREWSFRGTPFPFRDRYFGRRAGGLFELDPAIRRMVAFAPLNLVGGAYPSPITNTSAMDVILCRNVLMYFTPEIQKATVARLAQALGPGGWLAVSPAEASAALFHPLARASFSGAIFRRTEEAHAATPLPNLQAEIVEVSGPPGPSACMGIEPLPPAVAPGRHTDAEGEAVAPLRRARSLADQGDLDGARRLCEAALARERLDPEAYLLLAAVCQECGDISGALEALRRAIYLAPESPLAHFLEGALRFRQGDERGGRRAMTTAVHLLGRLARDEVVPDTDGVTAGRFLATATLYLEPQR
jgi:chemotaxis protein methyltransferase CheR